jgi:hypothetical protein
VFNPSDSHHFPVFSFISLTPKGFSRLETGAAGRGVWYHKYFIRDKPEMIKLIKRVPVKNPKQTVPTSKDQLPDYTKYQLPSSSPTDNGHPTAMNSLPVLQSHHNAVAAAAIKGGLATSDFLSSHSMRPPLPPPDRLDYLSTLAGRLPPVLPPRYFAAHNAPLQVPDGGASSIVSDQSRMYQASLLQHQALLAAGNPNPPPGGYGIGEVTQQLRNNPSSQNPMRHWDSNVDSAIVEYIRDSYRQGFPTPNINSVGFRQDVISAIMAQPDFYPQPPYGGGDGRPSTADFYS